MCHHEKETPIGRVTHYYGKINVAIVHFDKDISLGSHVHFLGHNTDLAEPVASLELNHHQVAAARRGEEVGVKVAARVREGDLVFEEPT